MAKGRTTRRSDAVGMPTPGLAQIEASTACLSSRRHLKDSRMLSTERMEKNRLKMPEMTKHHQKLSEGIEWTSEEEMVDEEKDKKEFVEAEDKIIRSAKDNITALLHILVMCDISRMTIEDLGFARYEALVSQQNAVGSSNSGHTDLNVEKDLEAAQDSFDHLFCRRCLSLYSRAPKSRVLENGVDEEGMGQHYFVDPIRYLKVPKLDGNAGTSLIRLDIEQKIGLSSDACESLRNIAFESEILGRGSEEANPSSPKLIFYRSRSSRRKDSSVPIGDQLTTGTDDTYTEKMSLGE
ncbi:hypothetical protein Tco_1338426 [Tanacetum coccineum]